MSKIGMLVTVGVGGRNPESLISAIVKSIQLRRPEVLALIHSHGSLSIAEQIKLHVNLPETILYCVSNENHVDKCFDEITLMIERLEQNHECARGTMIVDFTSGTKAMSAAVILASVSCGIQSISYIAGERKEGTVQAGFEEFLSITPTRYHIHHDIQNAIENLRQLRFAAAFDLLDRIPINILSEHQQVLIDTISQWCNFYREWDLFNHKNAVEILKKITEHPYELHEFEFSKQHLSRLVDISTALNSQSPTLTLDCLADLLNNANRRIHEGKYDDAAARLYRLTEMCAQYRLQKKHQIRTNRVRKEQVPDAFYRKYLHVFNDRNEAKIGLQKSFEILLLLKDEMGIHFQENKKLDDILQTRNKSILAHGFVPVDQTTCLNFQKQINQLLLMIDPSFGTRCKELQFPWMV